MLQDVEHAVSTTVLLASLLATGAEGAAAGPTQTLLLDAGPTQAHEQLVRALGGAGLMVLHETVRLPDHPSEVDGWHKAERMRLCSRVDALTSASDVPLTAVAIGNAGLPLLTRDRGVACDAFGRLDRLVLDSVPGSLSAPYFESGLYRTFEHGAINAARQGVPSSERRIPRHDPALDERLGPPQDVPTLHLGGWFRPHLIDTIDRWRHSPGDLHQLSVAAWSSSDGVSLGPAPARPERGEAIASFLAAASTPKRRVLVEHLEIGARRGPEPLWVDEMRTDCSPPCSETRWFLGPGGNLARDQPGPIAPSSWRANPRRPIATIGGSAWTPADLLDQVEREQLDLRPLETGAIDQRRLPPRQDLLRFQSEPLDRATDVHGEAEIELWLSTDVPDTAIVAALVDVHPDGRQSLLRRVALAARRRNGPGQPDQLLTRGQPVRLLVTLGPLSYRFGSSHRVGLHLSSSSWPAYEIHPNVDGSDPSAAGLSLPAFVTLFHDRDHPSSLSLPVVPAPPTSVPRADVIGMDE